MSHHRARSSFLGALALGALTAGAQAQSPSDSAGSDARARACFGHPVTRVEPYQLRDHDWGYGGSSPVLAGARVFVPAESGLTAEWLHRQLIERQRERRSEPGCPLDVEDVKVAVESGGPGFWINLSSSKSSTARELLEQARQLVKR